MSVSKVKIRAEHQRRLACVYIRQSTLHQVHHHRQSTERQYNLRKRALELGWPAPAIELIDEDQGLTGAGADHRRGFQRLLGEVAAQQVGVVLMLEASRLARSGSDWHRLIEICSLSGTLIADEDAVYDPRDPNDRLLLGMNSPRS